jgi:hypothetical protein
MVNNISIEQQRINLEQQRCDIDKELKLKELDILRKQASKSEWVTPIVVALLGGIIGLLANYSLEDKKQQGSLILEAIKTGDTKAAAVNLIFLSNTKLITLNETQQSNLKEIAGPNPLPSLPQAGILPSSSANEVAGFQALLEDDLEKAALFFQEAYHQHPTYHMVDEISNKVLTKEIINSYKNANTDEKKSILRNAVQKILKSYSWGMPDKISKELNAKFAQ